MDSKITTITMSGGWKNIHDNLNLNLLNIGKYINVKETEDSSEGDEDKKTDSIIGLKYNYNDTCIQRGIYRTNIYIKSKKKDQALNKINTKGFKNCIMLITRINNKTINVKLFKNGSTQLTGCKSLIDAEKSIELIFNKIEDIKKEGKIEIEVTYDENDVIVDKNKMIYSDIGKLIGYKKTENSYYLLEHGLFHIDTKTRMLYSDIMDKYREREIRNLNGKYIGISRIEVLKNNKKFIKKNKDLEYKKEKNTKWGTLIINKKINEVIAREIYDIDENMITTRKTSQEPNTKEPFSLLIEQNPYFDDNCESLYKKENYEFRIGSINMLLDLHYKLDREKLYNKLCNDYFCTYNPDNYAGIQLRYKFDINKFENNIDQNNKGQLTDSSCITISFNIFGSGKVGVSGFKSMNHIPFILQDFENLCNQYKNIIQIP